MSSYQGLHHTLKNKILGASKLPTEAEQREFVNQTFLEVHSWYTEKQVNHADYVKLINLLAAFKNGQFNDYIDILTGAAAMGLLDVAMTNLDAFSPERARQRSGFITKLTGVDPVQPDTTE